MVGWLPGFQNSAFSATKVTDCAILLNLWHLSSVGCCWRLPVGSSEVRAVWFHVNYSGICWCDNFLTIPNEQACYYYMLGDPSDLTSSVQLCYWVCRVLFEVDRQVLMSDERVTTLLDARVTWSRFEMRTVDMTLCRYFRQDWWL